VKEAVLADGIVAGWTALKVRARQCRAAAIVLHAQTNEEGDGREQKSSEHTGEQSGRKKPGGACLEIGAFTGGECCFGLLGR
jgi:hypothetical protein